MNSLISVSLLLLVLVATVSAGRHEKMGVSQSGVDTAIIKTEFVKFMQQHNRVYVGAELSSRLAYFAENYNFIVAHHNRFIAQLESYDVEVNKFADWSREEYLAYLTASPLGGPAPKGDYISEQKTISPSALPDSVDWRNTGLLTPVKDQGQCGSCWTFSGTGSMEAAWALKHGNKSLVSLSEQEYVDCLDGGTGCGGGWPRWTFEYAIDMGGADSEASYPYQGVDGPKCLFNKSNIAASFKSYVNLTSGDETALTTASSMMPGVSVCIDASHSGFSFYKSGVYKDSTCMKGVDDLDHAVLVAGYGYDNSTNMDYYWVKNSWGTSWGDAGYIKMFRDTKGSTNNCGIATVAAYPIAA